VLNEFFLINGDPMIFMVYMPAPIQLTL